MSAPPRPTLALQRTTGVADLVPVTSTVRGHIGRLRRVGPSRPVRVLLTHP